MANDPLDPTGGTDRPVAARLFMWLIIGGGLLLLLSWLLRFPWGWF